MKTPPHILATMMAATMMAPSPGEGWSSKSRKKRTTPKAVDKAKRAKRRQARASRKRNRR